MARGTTSSGAGCVVRHFLSQLDLTPAEIQAVFSRAAALKPPRYSTDLLGRTLVMFFEKSSTRTRLSFEIGMTQLGGHAIYLDRESSQLSRGESIEDTARVVSRYADLMMARVFAHATVEGLASSATIPVINGLSDAEHPCQSMADLFTLLEHKTRLAGLRMAYVGDGNNNVTHSLMLGAAALGAHLVVAAPPQFQPTAQFVDRARSAGASSGGTVELTTDPEAAVAGADVVYTDVWVSMGQEIESQRRREALQPYQVNERLVALAAPDFVFMHCLPAHIGEEVTADVAYGPHSIIFDQAENRLHVQKALMLFLVELNQGGR
jgi:ornithine carbamoyltransferase